MYVWVVLLYYGMLEINGTTKLGAGGDPGMESASFFLNA